jgi:hypothetical protein
MNEPSSPQASPSHALCVYAEPLVAGRRVVVVHDASQGLGPRLADLGARTVHVYDPDPERAREAASSAPRGVTIRALPGDDFDVRDGAFDVAIIPDLGLVAEPAPLVAKLRRLLGASGVALVATGNPEAGPRTTPFRSLDYYELYDLVALQFAHVRMVGQVPFHGVALAELGVEGEPEVSVDTQLVPESGTPEAFVAVASQADVRLSEYAIVRLPRQEAESGGAADFVTPALSEAAPPLSERAELAEAQLRASLLASQLDELRARASAPAVERGLEERAAQLEAASKEAEARATEHYVRAERLAHDLRQHEEELHRLRDREAHAAKQLEDERRTHAQVEHQLALLRKAPPAPAAAPEKVAALEEALGAAEAMTAALRDRLGEVEALSVAREQQLALQQAELSIVGEAHAAEIAQLEAALRERAQALGALEREIERRERIIRELVVTLEEAQESAGAVETAETSLPNVELQALEEESALLRDKLDKLALEAARREGEATSSGWRVAELEQELAVLRAASSPSPERASRGDAQQAALEDELAALRQALTQEHQERARAESGEELAKARAELARQATLIEQLSRELDAHDRLRIAREGASPP